MTKIYKILPLALLLFTSFGKGNAQQTFPSTQDEAKKKVALQGRIGINLSYFSAPYDNNLDPSSSKVGYNAGVVVDYRLSNSIYFQPGLMLTSKGGKFKDEVYNEVKYTTTINAVYLQLPLYFTWKIPVAKYPSNSLNISLGPYLGYGIAGKTELKPKSGGVAYTIDSFGDNGALNRLDVGLGFEFQMELKKIVFTLGSEMGMNRSMKEEGLSTSSVIANSNNYISVGYKF
jgi:hypothetical protein